MTGSRQRTLNSALNLSLRSLGRNQETLSYADQERYWQRISEEAERRLEDAAEEKKARIAERRRKQQASAAAPSQRAAVKP